MKSDPCSEDVVVHIAQINASSPAVSGVSAVSATTARGSGAGGRVAASSAAVELGRRLLLAARAGDTQQVLDLMAKGAPFTTDWLGTSPLHLAASNAHADTCRVLLRAGVSRDARTKVERTPLHLAAGAGHAGAARVLLDAGAGVDARDMLRMTPLHWAAVRGHDAVGRLLLARGADPLALNKFDKSPLSLSAELGRAALRQAMLDALEDREAARSVSALVGEHMEETTQDELQMQTIDAVQKIQEIKPTKQKQTEKASKIEGNIEEGAAVLLRRHGITLLPHDEHSTVLSALQSGRTVVLSDAGKLMLKESSETSEVAPPKAMAGSSSQKGMLLTATPVKSPPKPGVKIFTLNNKLLAISKDNKMPIKKIINPQDMQVKFVQLPPDAKIVSHSKLLPMKAKNRLRTVTPTPAGQGSQRPAVKIIMNKTNFNKLMANATRTSDQEAPEAGDADDSPAALRAQLAAAQRALATVRRDLGVARAKLAHYERLHQL